MTLKDAAEMLGVSKEAVRKRVQRGTLPSEVGEDGRRYVYLDVVRDAGPPGGDQGHHELRDRDDLVEELRSRVRALEEANRENRRLLAAALERIPAIEAPESPEGAEPQSARGTVPEEQQEATSRPQEEQRSWWRRMFGT